MIEGVDYSDARPDPTFLFQKGKRFAIRYLYGSLAGKAVTRTEVDRLHAAGLDVVLNWEWQNDEAKGGYNTGMDRAARAALAVASLKAPDDSVIYFSVDSDSITTDQARQYFRGIANVYPKSQIGVYGGRRIITAAKGERWCDWFWQTYAWSGVDNRFDPNSPGWVKGVHIQQYSNGVNLDGNVDLDRALVSEFGQWKAKEDDMATVPDAEWDEALRILRELKNVDWASTSRLLALVSGKPAVYTVDGKERNEGNAIAADMLTMKANLQTLLGKDFTDEQQIADLIYAKLGTVGIPDVVTLLRGIFTPEEVAELKATL